MNVAQQQQQQQQQGLYMLAQVAKKKKNSAPDGQTTLTGKGGTGQKRLGTDALDNTPATGQQKWHAWTEECRDLPENYNYLQMPQPLL